MSKVKITKLLALSSTIILTSLLSIGCTADLSELLVEVIADINENSSYFKEINDDYSNIYDVASKYLKEVEGIEAVPVSKEIRFKENLDNLAFLQFQLKDNEEVTFTVNVNKKERLLYHNLDDAFLSTYCNKEINNLTKKHLPEGSNASVHLHSFNSYSELKNLKIDKNNFDYITSNIDYISIESIFITLKVPEGTTDFTKYEENLANFTKELKEVFKEDKAYLDFNIIITSEDNYISKASNALKVYDNIELFNLMSKNYIEKNVKSLNLLSEDKKDLFSSVLGCLDDRLNTKEDSEYYLAFNLNKRLL